MTGRGALSVISRATRLGAMAGLVLALATPLPALAQGQVDVALRFFADGGSYCFRVIPFGVALSEESEWTMMVLTSTSNGRNTFRIRDVDAGPTRLTGSALTAAGMAVSGVWRSESDRAEFFRKFAEGIDAHVLRARVVKAGPPNLGLMKSDRDRAELYLKFSDRGARISFDKVPDLTAGEFQHYSEHFPD